MCIIIKARDVTNGSATGSGSRGFKSLHLHFTTRTKTVVLYYIFLEYVNIYKILMIDI